MKSITFSSPWVSRAVLAALALAAAGCTVQVVMPEVPSTHPAHPDAASAPLPEPSPLLDSYRPIEPPPEMMPMDHGAEEMDDESMDHDQMEMGQGVMGQEKMDRDAMESEGLETPAPDEPAEDEAEADEHHHPDPPPPPPAAAGARAT